MGTALADPKAAPGTTERPIASWQTPRPWLWAIAVALGGTVLTAFGAGFAQVRQLDPVAATYAQAVFVALSALLGLVVMWRTRPSLAAYGLRRPVQLRRALWALPLVVLPLILVLWVGVTVTAAQAVAYAALALAVGFSEEIWFRGLLLAVLRSLGTKTAIVGGSVIFGALHLANLFAGEEPLYLALQFALACLVGFVLAEVVTITGSLWIAIAWHACYDLAAFSTGDQLTPTALAALAVMAAVLVGYAVWLWRRLPEPDREATGGTARWS